MPEYRIHRMKDTPRQSFRWAAHTLGTAAVKPRDYLVEDAPVEAVSPYAAWHALSGTGRALQVGDLLQSDDGSLHLYKYVGFEGAQWALPEGKPAAEVSAPVMVIAEPAATETAP